MGNICVSYGGRVTFRGQDYCEAGSALVEDSVYVDEAFDSNRKYSLESEPDRMSKIEQIAIQFGLEFALK